MQNLIDFTLRNMLLGIGDMCYLIDVVADSVYLSQELYIFIGRAWANFFSHNQLADKCTCTDSGKRCLFYKALFFRIG